MRNEDRPISIRWIPAFWRDTGTWNDTVLSVSSFLGLAVAFAIALWFDLAFLGLLLLPVGIVAGFIGGLAAVSILGTYFSRD